MRNKDGDFDPNELIFVDFDQAAYGFRMFDTLYWAANTNHQFSIDEIMNMMQGNLKPIILVFSYIVKCMLMNKLMTIPLLLPL